MTRIILLFTLLISILIQAHYLAGIIFVGYLFWYTGYELVILAMLIDGYYGAFYGFPTLTVVTFLTWTIVRYLKKLLLYTGGNEVVS